MEKDWKEYLRKEKEKYNKFGFVKCPAFNNEEIIFNHYGFNHLLYKNGIPRPQSEVVERLFILKHIPNILAKVKIVDSEEKRVKDDSIAYFWTIKERIGSQEMRIIIRRINNGKLHFFSVMSE